MLKCREIMMFCTGVLIKSFAQPERKRLSGHLQPRRNWPTWAPNVFDNLPYSPDLAPSDYHLLKKLKKQLKGK
jgi:hypothetical protein